MELSDILTLIIRLGSLVLIPALGVLDTFKFNVFRPLMVILIAWFFLGFITIGGGATPMGLGDIITPEDRAAWFSSETSKNITAVWCFGLVTGIPFLIISRLHENRTFSTIWKALDAIAKLIVLIFGLIEFAQHYFAN